MNFERMGMIPPQEKASNEKEGNESLINQATSFEDLAKSIETNNISIQGSQEVFTPDMLKNVIAKIQSREWPLNAATGRDGFRAKVAELLQTDSNTDVLKQTLGDVENKLMTESYAQGASTDHPLNRRRDERLKWKERLQQDIQKMETESDEK